MNLKLKKYKEQFVEWPPSGHHIMAQYDDESIIVYQAYRPEIGEFAAKNQYFGGAFKLTRMTWIKPNFLWMMFRNGWGTKEGQEITLAIKLKMVAFIRYLKEAEFSSFDMSSNDDFDLWKESLASSSCRLQWDPDHDPFGNKLERRAIQIGISNTQIEKYAVDDIIGIENISDFVAQQRESLMCYGFDELMIPEEKPLVFNDDSLNKKMKIDI